MAWYEVTIQILWLRNFNKGLNIVDFIKRLMRIYCDNSTIAFNFQK